MVVHTAVAEPRQLDGKPVEWLGKSRQITGLDRRTRVFSVSMVSKVLIELLVWTRLASALSTR